jgi:hypothetical protein
VAAFLLATVPPSPIAVAASDAGLASRTVGGAFHVHSTKSDGAGDWPAVAAAASRAGLRFVIFTDHGDGTEAAAPPQYIDGVLCIEGVEISTNGGHYAAVGMQPAPYPLGGEGAAVVEDVARLGGFGIVTHPGSPKPALAWSDWSAPFDAVEWLNADSEWRDEPRLRLTRTFIDYMARPAPALASILDRPSETLERWDDVAARRRVLALAGHDAHGGIGRRGAEEGEDGGGMRVGIPSYEAAFRTFSTQVILDRPFDGDAPADAARLLEALRSGRSFTRIDGLAGPGTLAFTAQQGSNEWRIGEAISVAPARLTARASMPPGATLAILQNGKRIAESSGEVVEAHVTAAGSYRVEVSLASAPGTPPVPWLLSNPIFLHVLTTPPGSEPEILENALTLAVDMWRIEKQPSSSGTIGKTGTGLAVTYQLGAGARRSQFVAVAADLPAQVPPYDRLVFEARAQRPMRLSTQLRFGPASDSRWGRSVYVDSSWRRISVPIDTMVPMAPSPGAARPDRHQARSVLFVVDLTNARPGATGTFEIGHVALARVPVR